MCNDLGLSMVSSETELEVFWDLFNDYINELSMNASFGDEFDVNYFYSEDYRGAISKLRTRQSNPLRKILIRKEDLIIGFIMYVTYFDEDGKCLLMEYYIDPKYRGLGYGRYFYLRAESHIRNEGALYIELTPTNEENERFWCSVGFNKSKDKDEDNKYYYRKYL